MKKDIHSEIERMDKQRRRNKRQAFALRIAVVLVSATTTVLLGFKAEGDLGVALTNAALVLSATATVVVAWDAFYNPRALWIMEVSHLARLQVLDRRFADQHAQSGGNLTEDQLDALRDDFEILMAAHLTVWKSLREQQSATREVLDGEP